MAGFFKKALSVFVEFEEDNKGKSSAPHLSSFNPGAASGGGITPNTLNQAEAEKFEKYFDNLFDKANMPGPDYFEFYKTMETLEAHIPDEKARFAATFASLSIQGLNKKNLLETAAKYKEIIVKDQANFESVVDNKLKSELGDRQQKLKSLEQKIAGNSEQIQRLTKEINEAQALMGQLNNEVLEQENKLSRNKSGYETACRAVLSKIESDIQKIQTNL